MTGVLTEAIDSSKKSKSSDSMHTVEERSPKGGRKRAGRSNKLKD